MPRWQVYCAVALRRLPELIPRRDPIELRVQQIFEAYEASKSRYSKHEVQNAEDISINDDSESDVIVKETAQDRLDRWMRVKAEFKHSEHNDRLSKMQYLFVKTKFGSDIKDQWILPQTTFDRELGDKDLIDTARRALRDNLNIFNGFTIVSRIPSSHYSFKYPRKVVDSVGYDGAKVFFVKAHLDRPSESVIAAVNSNKSEKLTWVTSDEAQGLVNKKYLSGLRKGLLDEGRVDVAKVMMKAHQYAETSKSLANKSAQRAI